MIPAYQSLLQVANNAVSQRRHRFGTFAHVRSPLRACHVRAPSFMQATDALKTVNVNRCTRGHSLLKEAGQRCALEAWNNRPAAATGGPSAFLHGHENQRRFPTPELATSLQPRLSTPNPGFIYLHFTPQWFARQVDQGPSELEEYQPRGFVPTEAKLALKKKRREVFDHQEGHGKEAWDEGRKKCLTRRK